MKARLVSVAALVGAIVLLSACGGSSSSDQTSKFRKSYNPLRGQLEQNGKAIGTAVQNAGSSTDAQLLVQFRGLASRWQAVLSRVETLKPPSKAAADFNTLTSAGSRVESDLRAVVAASATHSAAAARQAGASIVTDFLSVRQADKALYGKIKKG